MKKHADFEDHENIVLDLSPSPLSHKYLGLQHSLPNSQVSFTVYLMNNVKNKNNVYVYYHAKKPLRSKKNIKCTLKFCRKYKNWTAEDWLLFIHTAMNKEWNQNFLQEQFGDDLGIFSSMMEAPYQKARVIMKWLGGHYM